MVTKTSKQRRITKIKVNLKVCKTEHVIHKLMSKKQE